MTYTIVASWLFRPQPSLVGSTSPPPLVGLAASRFPRTRAAAIPGGGGFKANDKQERSSCIFCFPVLFAQASLAQVLGNKKPDCRRVYHLLWRREWDSNPRYGHPVYRLSRSALSTTQTPLR